VVELKAPVPTVSLQLNFLRPTARRRTSRIPWDQSGRLDCHGRGPRHHRNQTLARDRRAELLKRFHAASNVTALLADAA
jgi:hypothetical protein